MSNNPVVCAKLVHSSSWSMPNLLLARTYALNKSSSKRVCVGLENHGGFYKTVVKLCSTGSPRNYVTLDVDSWELVCDQMEAMNAYLQNAFTFYQDFGNPTKVFLPNHDLTFTTAYGSRAIAIDERPCVVHEVKYTTRSTQEAAVQKGETQHENAAATEGKVQPENATAEGEAPPCKKKKLASYPGILMQEATFNGLREMRECVTLHAKHLEVYASYVNRARDHAVDVLRGLLPSESSNEKTKSILKDAAAFKHFYTLNRNAVEDYVKVQMESVHINVDVLKFILAELYAFGLPALAQFTYETLQCN